jgi:hypothetical protein
VDILDILGAIYFIMLMQVVTQQSDGVHDTRILPIAHTVGVASASLDMLCLINPASFISFACILRES